MYSSTCGFRGKAKKLIFSSIERKRLESLVRKKYSGKINERKSKEQ